MVPAASEGSKEWSKSVMNGRPARVLLVLLLLLAVAVVGRGESRQK